jgi:signal recognition particle subunit SEC65
MKPALPLRTDIVSSTRHFRKVPKAGIDNVTANEINHALIRTA